MKHEIGTGVHNQVPKRRLRDDLDNYCELLWTEYWQQLIVGVNGK
jgi:hypothetical protein